MGIKLNSLLLLAFIALVASSNLFKTNLKDSSERKHYAVIVCGSNGYHNYADQADVAHVYKSLVATGMTRENIILFFYDDVARSSQNPFPGQLFNKPADDTKGDVYAGIQIDYKGKDVIPQNLLNVLEGNAEAMKGIGSGRVLESGPDDYVFFYFNDHGSTGLICFPYDDLYADDLLKTIKKMHDNKQYAKMAIFVDTCYSGSMFNNLLKDDLNVWATTSASPYESAWMTYCGYDDLVAGKRAGPCLGAEYSTSFTDYVDEKGLEKTTIGDAFEFFKPKVPRSKIQHYGDLSIESKIYAEFFGVLNVEDDNNNKGLVNKVKSVAKRAANMFGNAKSFIKNLFNKEKLNDTRINSYNVKSHYLYGVAKQTNDNKAWEEYKREIAMNKRSDAVFKQFDEALNQNKNSLNTENINFECLKPSVKAFETICKTRNEYSIQYAFNIAAACQDHTIEEIRIVFKEICEAY